MPSIRELRRHLDAAGVDHSAARDRGALEELCVSRGLARREPAPSQPCAACREPLAGPVVEIGGRPYHRRCAVCAVCAVALGKEVVVRRDGAFSCERCARAALEATAPKCGACDAAVVEGGCQVDGAYFHRACVRCAACAKALVSTAPGSTKHRIKMGKDRKVYCHGCLEERFGEICGCCGKPAIRYARSEATGQSLCLSCVKRAGCDSCFLRRGGPLVERDGFKHCDVCAATAVTSDADANAIMSEVVDWLRRAHGLRSFLEDEGLRGLGVRLVDEQRMTTLAKGSRHGSRTCPLGITVSERRVAVSSASRSENFAVRDVYARRGLPRARLASVLAHELCHAFFTMKSFRKAGERPLPLAVEEGCAELWASLWLEGHDDPSSRTFLALMAASTDPVYGDGYRKAKAAFRRAPSLIDFMRGVRRAKQLP